MLYSVPQSRFDLRQSSLVPLLTDSQTFQAHFGSFPFVFGVLCPLSCANEQHFERLIFNIPTMQFLSMDKIHFQTLFHERVNPLLNSFLSIYGVLLSLLVNSIFFLRCSNIRQLLCQALHFCIQITPLLLLRAQHQQYVYLTILVAGAKSYKSWFLAYSS